jgi:hypothetical protein
MHLWGRVLISLRTCCVVTLVTKSIRKPTQIVELFDTHSCTDPRDRLFSLLGLVDEQDVADNIADYDMSVYDVQVRFLKASIARTQNLDILNCFRGPSSNPDHKPWAPFWSANKPCSNFFRVPNFGFRSLRYQSAPFRVFNASKDMKPQANFMVQEGTEMLVLKMCGLIVDAIEYVGDAIKIRDNSSESRSPFPTTFDWDLYARPQIKA